MRGVLDGGIDIFVLEAGVTLNANLMQMSVTGTLMWADAVAV